MNMLKKGLILFMVFSILLVSGCGRTSTGTKPEISMVNDYDIVKKGSSFKFEADIYDADVTDNVRWIVGIPSELESEDPADWGLTENDFTDTVSGGQTTRMEFTGIAYKVGVFDMQICVVDGTSGKGQQCAPFTLEIEPVCVVDGDCPYDAHYLGGGQMPCLRRTCTNPNSDNAACVKESTVFNPCGDDGKACVQFNANIGNCTSSGAYGCCPDVPTAGDYPCEMCE